MVLLIQFSSVSEQLLVTLTKQNRAHQCDETQGNNSTRALSTKNVFFGWKNIDILSILSVHLSFCTLTRQLLSHVYLVYVYLSIYLLAPEQEIFCRMSILSICIYLCTWRRQFLPNVYLVYLYLSIFLHLKKTNFVECLSCLSVFVYLFSCTWRRRFLSNVYLLAPEEDNFYCRKH